MYIKAEFFGGVLRPVRPLGLRPGEVVRLCVGRQSQRSRWDPERMAATSVGEDAHLADAGLARWASDLDEEDRR